jgi:hypothetical protein
VILYEVTDREAMEGCVDFLDDKQLLVEPACGAGVRAVYGRDGGRGLAAGVEKNSEKDSEDKEEKTDKDSDKDSEEKTDGQSKRGKAIVVEVCGGKMVSLNLLAQWDRDLPHNETTRKSFMP